MCYFEIDTWKWDFWVKKKMKTFEMLLILLYTGCTILSSHYQGTKGSVSPKYHYRIHCQSFGLFLPNRWQKIGEKLYLSIVLIHISLTLSKMEHLFVMFESSAFLFFIKGQFFLAPPFPWSPVLSGSLVLPGLVFRPLGTTLSAGLPAAHPCQGPCSGRTAREKGSVRCSPYFLGTTALLIREEGSPPQNVRPL